MSDHAPHSEENEVPHFDRAQSLRQEDLLEQVLDASNLNAAWKRVKANKGAPGIDGMSIEDFPAFAREHMERLKEQMREGRYKPAAVRRVWIPKPNGEERPLGIPTVLDRVVQQALAQILGPICYSPLRCVEVSAFASVRCGLQRGELRLPSGAPRKRRRRAD